MRTEDDLRTALAALERYAPEAARVMPGGERRSSRGLRPPRTAGWIAVAVTTAGLAGAVTALTLPAASTSSLPNGGVTSPAIPADDPTLRAKLLAAFSAARGDVVYESSTSLNTGASPIVTEAWSYPSRPRPGQLVRERGVTYNLSGTMHTDEADIFVMPGHEKGPFSVKGERIIVDHAGKTWSDDRDVPLPVDDPNTLAQITDDIKTAHWTVSKTTLNGRAALELSIKEKAEDNSSTVHLWVDAATYLPLRETDVFGPPGMVNHTTTEYAYLPPTPANLAQLTTKVPVAGFKRVTQYPLSPVPVAPASSVRPSPR